MNDEAKRLIQELLDALDTVIDRTELYSFGELYNNVSDTMQNAERFLKSDS